MHIAIIGAGNLGAALARRWVAKGHKVSLSFARDTNRLDALAQDLGPNASVAWPDIAAAEADVVLLSVPYDAVDAAIEAFRSGKGGKPLITTVSPYAADFSGESVNLVSQSASMSAAEQIAAKLPAFHVVEAFNLTFADLLKEPILPFAELRPTIPFCSDHAPAKRAISTLIADAGMTPLDVGNLRAARVLETMATAWVQLAAVSGLFPRTGLAILTPTEPTNI